MLSLLTFEFIYKKKSYKILFNTIKRDIVLNKQKMVFDVHMWPLAVTLFC